MDSLCDRMNFLVDGALHVFSGAKKNRTAAKAASGVSASRRLHLIAAELSDKEVLAMLKREIGFESDLRGCGNVEMHAGVERLRQKTEKDSLPRNCRGSVTLLPPTIGQAKSWHFSRIYRCHAAVVGLS
jgi:hypothetical protein